MHKRWLQAGLLVWASSALGVQAESAPAYFGGVAFGYTTLEFDAKLDSTPSFETLVLTGGARIDDYTLVVSYADSIGNTSISEEEDFGQGKRRDLDLTLFYRLADSWNLFLGYKDSETKIDFTLRDDVIVRPEFYRKDGWFAGVTYNLTLQTAGTLGFSLGYVDLTTDDRFLEDEPDPGDPEPTEFDDLTGRQSGDADGWSYGVNWLVPVNNQLYINTTIKINDYDQEITFNGATFSTDQTLKFFNVGVVYLF